MIIRFTILIIAFSCLFSKQVIAVLDLDAINYTQEQAQVITTKIISEIINLNVYNVVERSNINRILSEQKLQNSGCTDSECAVEVGQLINADLIVIGTVSSFKELYSIDTKLINIETGEIIKIASFASEIDQKELFTKGVYDIASQISGIKSNKKYTSKSIDGRKKFTIELGYLNNISSTHYLDSSISSYNGTIKYRIGDITLGAGYELRGFRVGDNMNCIYSSNTANFYKGDWLFTYNTISFEYQFNNLINGALRNPLIGKILNKLNVSGGAVWMYPNSKVHKNLEDIYYISCSHSGNDYYEPISYSFNAVDVKELFSPYIRLAYNFNNILISFEIQEDEQIIHSREWQRSMAFAYNPPRFYVTALKLGYAF